MKITSLSLFVLSSVFLFACTKKVSVREGTAPTEVAKVAAVPIMTPGVLKKGALGAVFLMGTTKDSYNIKIVFPNEQVSGTSAPENQDDLNYTKRTYPVSLESHVAFYDKKGFLGKFDLKTVIQGQFWCENDGGTKYRPEHTFEIKKDLFSRPLLKVDKSSEFAAFAVIDETTELGAITYQLPTNHMLLFKQQATVGKVKTPNVLLLVWDEAGEVKYGPYVGLAAGNSYYTLTCDGP
jgi:hypothetical protein